MTDRTESTHRMPEMLFKLKKDLFISLWRRWGLPHQEQSPLVWHLFSDELVRFGYVDPREQPTADEEIAIIPMLAVMTYVYRRHSLPKDLGDWGLWLHDHDEYAETPRPRSDPVNWYETITAACGFKDRPDWPKLDAAVRWLHAAALAYYPEPRDEYCHCFFFFADEREDRALAMTLNSICESSAFTDYLDWGLS